MMEKQSIFDLSLALFAAKHNVSLDYTSYTIGQKMSLLYDVAKILNKEWRPRIEDDYQEKRCLIANPATQEVETWEVDRDGIDQSILFSPEAAEAAKKIIPYEFLKSFWEQ